MGDSNTVRLYNNGLITLQQFCAKEGIGIQTALSEPLVTFRGTDERYTMAQAVAMMKPRRVVITDLTLIVQGVAEAVRFSNIPLKVTINEYVDISKFYSTANSRVFVNGLLDRILRKMVDTGEIVKTGRGLIES